MNNIPTAQEFFNKRLATVTQEECNGKSPMMQVMIEFAKLHVQAALKAAAEKLSSFRASAYTEIVKDSYPLDKIK